jgi:flagellar biosynthesis anti-sigma factor FlgM
MTISIGGMGSQSRTELNDSSVDRVTSNRNDKTNDKSETSAAEASSAETTSLVAGRTSLATLTATAMQGEDVRTDKVAQLRQAIGSGTYQVEPAQVAEAMLKEWQRP